VLSDIVNDLFELVDDDRYKNNGAFIDDLGLGKINNIDLKNQFLMEKGSIFLLSAPEGAFFKLFSIKVANQTLIPVQSVNLLDPSYFGSGIWPLELITSHGTFNSQYPYYQNNFIVFDVTELFMDIILPKHNAEATYTMVAKHTWLVLIVTAWEEVFQKVVVTMLMPCSWY